MCYDGASGSGKHRRVERLQRGGSTRGSNAWQEAQLKEAFDVMDRDGDGMIKAEDLSQFLQCALKSELSEEDVATMIALADRDGNGGGEFEEFLTLVQPHVPRRSESLASLGNETWAQMFRVLDRNGDGVLCAEDLSGAMGSLGQALSSDDLMAMLETATGSERRQVTLEDFCLLMSSAAVQ